MRFCTGLTTLTLGLIAAGCAGNSGTPLSPREFVTPRPGAENGTITKQTDQNGTLVYGELHAPLLPDEYTNMHPTKPPVISPLAREATSETQPAASQPAGEAVVITAATQSSQTTGTYQVVGTVISIVNGHPIYADKVIAKLETQFAANARRLSYEAFKADAAEKIAAQVDVMAEDQKQIAAANESLSADEKKNADGYTAAWIDEQVKAAGGSRELAKEKALNETGETLDELANEERDKTLVQIYYQTKLIPLIEVSPGDIRHYYEQHLTTDYTQTAQAKFRIIKIIVANRGSIEDAERVVERVVGQLKGGKDFATLAKAYNDDPSLKSAAGQVGQDGWVQKGSYVDDVVENTVWKLNVGEYTETPIRVSRDNSFVLAMLEAKKPGAVRPFDDQVQEDILNTLKKEQLFILREKLGQTLQKQSVRFNIEGGIQTAVQMAMQRYPAWAAAK